MTILITFVTAKFVRNAVKIQFCYFLDYQLTTHMNVLFLLQKGFSTAPLNVQHDCVYTQTTHVTL